MPDCFCAGTRLMTLRGEVPVETMRAGDRVLTLSGNGAALKAVTWIGRIDIDLDRHPDPAAVAPVRVRAGAFEPGMPIRDLLVSPDHALSVEEDSGGRVLIPAFYLVNGVTVLREPAAGQVSYFHVELEQHDILMADGLAAESYPDAGDRAVFTRTVVPFAPRDTPRDAPCPRTEPATDFTPRGRTRQGCAPYLWGNAAIPVHARLLERAYALGHALTEDPDLAVLVDGVRLDPLSDLDGEFLYLLPAGAAEVRLRSRVRVPVETDPASGDTRRLGIALGMALHDGVELDDSAFASGFLPKEGTGEGESAGSWRWSTGDAVLALAPSAQESTLELHIHMGWSRYWAPPEQPAEAQGAMP